MRALILFAAVMALMGCNKTPSSPAAKAGGQRAIVQVPDCPIVDDGTRYYSAWRIDMATDTLVMCSTYHSEAPSAH
jgi:hypothetical protein